MELYLNNEISYSEIPSVLSNQDCFLSWTGWSVVFNDPVSNSAWQVGQSCVVIYCDEISNIETIKTTNIQDRMRILHPGSENGSSCNYGEYINRIGIQYMDPLTGPYEDLNIWEQQGLLYENFRIIVAQF